MFRFSPSVTDTVQAAHKLFALTLHFADISKLVFDIPAVPIDKGMMRNGVEPCSDGRMPLNEARPLRAFTNVSCAKSLAVSR